MSSNAELAAKLLRDAAVFFRSVGEQNAELTEQMRSNADTYDMVADWVEKDAGAEGAPGKEPGGDGESGREPVGEGSVRLAAEGGSGGEKTGPGDG